MAESSTQTFENHTRWVPLYHFVSGPIFLVNFIVAAYRMVTGFSLESALAALVALALVFAFFFLRLFALSAQDRVIRLEERMRMQTLLPDDLKSRIHEFSTGQLVALRFASDGELPELARKTLDEKIADQKQIKQAIKSWRPDLQRV